MTAIGAAVPHRERLSRAAKAAEQRRVLSECAARVHAPPAAWPARRRDGAAAAHAGALFLVTFFGRAKKVTRPKGGKSSTAVVSGRSHAGAWERSAMDSASPSDGSARNDFSFFVPCIYLGACFWNLLPFIALSVSL